MSDKYLLVKVQALKTASRYLTLDMVDIVDMASS